eukprot:9159536-Ditylum_brightwellii.AAC.1
MFDALIVDVVKLEVLVVGMKVDGESLQEVVVFQSNFDKGEKFFIEGGVIPLCAFKLAAVEHNGPIILADDTAQLFIGGISIDVKWAPDNLDTFACKVIDGSHVMGTVKFEGKDGGNLLGLRGDVHLMKMVAKAIDGWGCK